MRVCPTRLLVPALSGLLVVFLAATVSTPYRAADDEPSWEFLSTSAIGADEFIEAHPSWDGRGTVIAILDTGVEPAMPGMRTTSDGLPKILDLRDFSGQGDVHLGPPATGDDPGGRGWYVGDGPWLRGVDAISPAPDMETVKLGYLREESFENAAVPDLDGDGDTGDVFGVIVYREAADPDGPRRVVVDVDGDGRIDDESVRTDFLEAPETFALGRPTARSGVKPVHLAVNLWDDDPDKVTFAFDDGAHGSHVAGIAAGHAIGGIEGQDGIAPGARIISLKIGNNELSGGATTTGSMLRAWRYAAEWSRNNDVPVVAQMSYGVGAENEGTARAEVLIDELLEEHPLLVGTVSNGNEGPGLSTAGLPSCSRHVIASGAVMNTSTAKTLYGVDLPHDRLFFFSSRGAEMAKPDVAAPGFAASTVPAWREGRDVMRGTSMASPQTAGAASLIMSAARANELPVVGAYVKAALRRGAVPLPDTTVLDQGPGLVDVPRAWEVYRELVSREGLQALEWTVETVSPDLPGLVGPAAHWRGITPSAGREGQRVTVTPRFGPEATDAERNAFYRAFDLVSTAEWVQPDRTSVRSRAATEIGFELVYDERTLATPGLHTARILAFDKTLSRRDRERLGPEWDFPVSVVVPHRPVPGELLLVEDVAVEPAGISRHYVRVPRGANGMTLRASIDEGSERRARVFLHDPEGRRHVLSWMGGGAATTTTEHVADDGLFPGVWEIVAFGDRENDGPVEVDLEVRFDALVLDTRIELGASEGRPPFGTLSITNRSVDTFAADASARVVGYEVADTSTMKDGTLRKTFHMGPDVEAVDLHVAMSGEDWGLFTDVAVRVLDGEGHAVLSDGMVYRLLDSSVQAPSSGESSEAYTLAVDGALADADDASHPVELELVRTYRFPQPIPVKIANSDDLVLYPDRAVELDLSLERTPPALPDGARWVVELELQDRDDARRKQVSTLTATLD